MTPSSSVLGTAGAQGLTVRLLIACSIALLLSSIYRATTIPFTIDESLSFAIFSWNPSWGAKANNHLLNTTLMQWCSVLFGNSELSLRLPNVLAHGVYLLCALALIRRLEHPGLQLTGFMLFNLNLFLLDFFSLARGYGLALAFEMLSLYLLVRGYEKSPQRGSEKCLYLSAAAGALAVLSNFSLLNCYLPLVLAGAWLLLNDASARRISRGHLSRTLVFLSANGVFLAFILFKILKLRRVGQLYVGGNTGFIADTVQSLVRSSLYSSTSSPATIRTIGAIVVAMFFLLLMLGLYQLLVSRQQGVFGVLVLVLAAAVALPMLQHRVLHTVYPIERAALYYLPLYAVVFVFGLHAAARPAMGRWKRVLLIALSAAITVPLGWHFYRHYNGHASYSWSHDSHNTEVLDIISRDRARRFPERTVMLRASGLMQPSLNFYRITRHYTWLLPLEREAITSANADYIYAFEHDLDTLRLDRGTRLGAYADIHTVLLRVHHPDEP
jgi:hypothetical protein